MSGTSEGTSAHERIPIGRAVVPVQFGDQVIVSILYNHDANPVHHRPDHAILWMLGLITSFGSGVNDPGLENAGSEEKIYTLGTKLLARPDVVVMPGIVLAAICYERFIKPDELTASITTTFTYPLLVPTKGSVDVTVEACELKGGNKKPLNGRTIQIEAFGPGIANAPTRLLKIEAEVYSPSTSPDAVYEQIVAPQFAELTKLAGKLPGMPELAHPSSISQEDRRRYTRIIEPGIEHVHPITENAWQCKIPRVLTEVIDLLRLNDNYQKEVRGYYAGRADEAERRDAIKRYVGKELKYHWLDADQADARIEELAQMAQHLYARQHTVFDPRRFRNGIATKSGMQVRLDLSMSEMRLRRGIHRFYTGGHIKDECVFMGEATVTSQPMVTRELANFLCEVNHNLRTLKLLEYKGRANS